MSSCEALPARAHTAAAYPLLRFCMLDRPHLTNVSSFTCRERLSDQGSQNGALSEHCRQLSEAVGALSTRVDELGSRRQAPVSERAVKHDVSLLVDAVQAGSWVAEWRQGVGPVSHTAAMGRTMCTMCS